MSPKYINAHSGDANQEMTASKTRDLEQHYANQIKALKFLVKGQSKLISKLQIEKSTLQTSLQQAEDKQSQLQEELAVIKEEPATQSKDPLAIFEKGVTREQVEQSLGDMITRLSISPVDGFGLIELRDLVSEHVPVPDSESEGETSSHDLEQAWPAYKISAYDSEFTWIVDLRATEHATPVRTAFSTFTPCDSFTISTQVDPSVEVLGYGTVVLWTATTGGRHVKHVLHSVKYVPSAKVSTLSLNAWITDSGVELELPGDGRAIFQDSEGQQVGHAISDEGWWYCVISPAQHCLWEDSVTVQVDPDEEILLLRDLLRLKTASAVQAQFFSQSTYLWVPKPAFLRENQARSLARALIAGCGREQFGSFKLRDLMNMIHYEFPGTEFDDSADGEPESDDTWPSSASIMRSKWKSMAESWRKTRFSPVEMYVTKGELFAAGLR